MARTPLRFSFVGVTASASSILRVFPRWAELLELEPVRFQPLDLPLDSDRATYRRVLRDIRNDPRHVGALVTTHKVRLLHAARDLFDALDDNAQLCDEVSCISKRGGRVIGHAKDPITAGRALDDLLAPDHFRVSGGEVVCLGAGGAGLAIAVCLQARRRDRPARITLVDRDADRLHMCRTVLAGLPTGGTALRYVVSDDATRNDDVVTAAAPGSLIINATGMGKDRPGSPLTDGVRFPAGAVAWELNYRGDLGFVRQARTQAQASGLTVEDGWRYFIHGWSEVIAEVFGVELTAQVLRDLSVTAAAVRS